MPGSGWRMLWAVALVATTGCAGSTSFEACAPNVCGCDFETCEDLELAAGDTAVVVATLLVEGSHRGTYTLSASADPEVTTSISPATADLDGDTPLGVTITVDVSSEAQPGDFFLVTFDAVRDKGDIGAGSSFTIVVP